MASFVALPAVAATSMESVPGCRLTGTENAPDDPAVGLVVVVAGAAAPAAVPLTATSTVAPGDVVPVTVVVAAFTTTVGRVRLAGTFPADTDSGAVTASGAAAGGLDRSRAATIDACSSSRPAAMSETSRSSCASAQVSGAAEPS